MKAEPLLAQLYALRKEFSDEPDCIEYQTLHHVFCFVSYKMGEFQQYLNEAEESSGVPATEGD